MILKNLALTMGLLATTATTSFAASVYGTPADLTGTRSGSSEITGVGTGNFYTGLSVSWTITHPTANEWDYSYTFTSNADKPAFSHLILEVTQGTTLADFSNLAVTGDSNATFDAPTTYTPGGNGGSDPNLPANIYGIKITPSNSLLTMTVTFSSTHEPVWGNFYVTGANGGPNSSQAYNAGMAIAGFDSNDKTLFIARPDGGTGAVPEPSSLVLLGCGAIGLTGAALRRRKPRLV